MKIDSIRSLLVATIFICASFFLQGCGRNCYPTELQLAAEMEKSGCQDLGWAYWAKENKNLRAIVCTGREGDIYHQFEVTEKGLCEVGYLREST